MATWREEITGLFPAGEYPHLMELTTEHVLKPGYDFGDGSSSDSPSSSRASLAHSPTTSNARPQADSRDWPSRSAVGHPLASLTRPPARPSFTEASHARTQSPHTRAVNWKQGPRRSLGPRASLTGDHHEHQPDPSTRHHSAQHRRGPRRPDPDRHHGHRDGSERRSRAVDGSHRRGRPDHERRRDARLQPRGGADGARPLPGAGRQLRRRRTVRDDHPERADALDEDRRPAHRSRDHRPLGRTRGRDLCRPGHPVALRRLARPRPHLARRGLPGGHRAGAAGHRRPHHRDRLHHPGGRPSGADRPARRL